MILGVVQDFALAVKAGEVSAMFPGAKGKALLRYQYIGLITMSYIVQACLEFPSPIDGVIKPKWEY